MNQATHYITALCFLFSSCIVYSQSRVESEKERSTEQMAMAQKKRKSRFLLSSIGSQSVNFRDFATSPLFYYSAVGHLELEFMHTGVKRDGGVGVSFQTGTIPVRANVFTNQEVQWNRVELQYNQLYRIPVLLETATNIKIGYRLQLSGIVRDNPILLNNSFGFELFPQISFSSKATIDRSRKELIKKTFLFWEYNLHPRTKYWSFQVDYGVLNGSVRNGYAYLSLNGINDYEFSTAGVHVRTNLQYTYSLRNQNAIRVGYQWEMLHTGGAIYNRFELSMHTISLSFLFKTNANQL